MILTDLVKDKTVHFEYYREGELWYRTSGDFAFPVPIADTGMGVFKANDKAIFFMRWIRKQLEVVLEWENQKTILDL